MKQHWIILSGSLLIMMASFLLWQFGFVDKVMSVLVMVVAEISFIVLVRYHYVRNILKKEILIKYFD